MAITILRFPAVKKKRANRSHSAHYLDIQQGLFTPPVSIGPRAVGWPDNEVEAINAARIAGCSDNEIRVLVCQLIAERKLLLPALLREVATVTHDDIAAVKVDGEDGSQ
jgi:prophage regulatory protein